MICDMAEEDPHALILTPNGVDNEERFWGWNSADDDSVCVVFLCVVIGAD